MQSDAAVCPGRTFVRRPGDGIQNEKTTCRGLLVAVSNHSLKLRTVVVGATLRSVDVPAHDRIAVVCSKFAAGLELTFDRLLTLAVA